MRISVIPCDTAELNVFLGFLCLSCVTLAKITDVYFMFGLHPQDMDSEGSTNFRTSILATDINCGLICNFQTPEHDQSVWPPVLMLPPLLVPQF